MKTNGFLIILTLLIFVSCGTKPANEKKEEPVSASPRKTLFSVSDSGSYKRVDVYGPSPSSPPAITYILYHKGNIKPKVNFKAEFVATPVERAAVLSSLYIGCLEKLGLLDKVIAVDNKNYINNPVIRSKIEKGEIKEISTGAELDLEQTLLLNPELIITYGSSNPEKDQNKKTAEAGIVTAYSLDHLENDPIERARWLKFVALFFEKESLADSILKRTERNYDSLKLIASLTPFKPRVLTEIKQSDAWFVPGGKSFMAKMLNDAGAEYVWKDNDKTGSLALSYEEVYEKATDADFWLQLSSWNKLSDCTAQDERNKNFRAFQKKNLFNNNALLNKEGGNAYWETGLISPDEILKDLIHIFHPELLPGHSLKYYQQLK